MSRPQQENWFDRCIRCTLTLSELETDDCHPTEVLIMVENELAGTGHA